MSRRVALCLDEKTCCNPGLLGLEGESFDAQNWLSVYPEGAEARARLAGDASIGEAWVVSCDDVEPINLAATLKADRPDLRVLLVTPEGCGSLYSRAHTAHIDEVLEIPNFVRCYLDAKRDAQLEGVQAIVATQGNAGIGMGEAPVGGMPSPGTTASPALSHATPETAQMINGVPGSAVNPDASSRLRGVPSPVAAHSQRRAFVMPVVSGSGGAGKSAVSVLAAHNAAARGLKTLLLDYDLQFGDVASMAGVAGFLRIDEAIAHPDKLERELARTEQLSVLAAPSRLEAAEDIVAGLPGFLDSLIPRYDVVIANTGAAWAEQHAALLERSTVALFLIDQRISSVRACRHAIELCGRCGIATGSFRYVLNRCAKGAPLSAVDVSSALQGAVVLELKDGGRDVENCLSSGAVGELIETGNEFIVGIDRLMSQILPPGSAASFAGQSEAENPKAVKRRSRIGRRRGRKSL